MLAAKIVPDLRCEPCGHVFKAFVRAADDWKTPCPCCGKQVLESSRGRRTRDSFAGNRRFAGSEAVSRTEGFRPFEVKRARKNLPQYQHCIRDDGSVVFQSRQEQRGFVRAQSEWFSRLEARQPRPDPAAERRELESIWRS